MTHRKVGMGDKEGQKGSFLRSQRRQLWQMRHKPLLTTTCLLGPSGPALPFPRVGGDLLLSSGAMAISLPGPHSPHRSLTP